MASTIQAEQEKKDKELMEAADVFAHEPKGFQFDPIEHVYTLNGRRLYGITNVLSVVAKPALIQWSAGVACDHIEAHAWLIREGNDLKTTLDHFNNTLKEARVAHTKKKEKAGELGTQIHEQLESYIKAAINLNNGKLEAYILPDDALAQVREFFQWAIVNDVKFLGSEVRLYSEKLWVAGTCDFVAEVGGKLMIGDIKTSSNIYDEHFWQATAYAFMAREMGLYKKYRTNVMGDEYTPEFQGVVIVNIPKRGGIVVKENYDLKGNFQIFKAALTIFKGKEAQRVKRIKK